MTQSRLAAALQNPQYQFSRLEVAYLMATSYRWGYETRVDEENGLIDKSLDLYANGEFFRRPT